MPVIIAAVVLLAFVLLFAIAFPLFTLIQRYRMGTARRRTRGWVATINVGAIAISAVLLTVIAALSSIWIPRAFVYTLAGFGVGCVLGLVGLLVTRWEPSGRALFYTPSRLLVLTITLVVAARIAYGFWRSWHAWQLAAGDTSWIAHSGAAGSLGAGATVIAYYFIYWSGILYRHHRYRRVGR